MLDVYCILYFSHLLGGFLHICALYMYYICVIWLPDNVRCTFITWYQSPDLGLIFSDAQLVRDFFHFSSGRRPPTPAAAAFPLPWRPAVWPHGGFVCLARSRRPRRSASAAPVPARSASAALVSAESQPATASTEIETLAIESRPLSRSRDRVPAC
jgi:hypothetical protein